MMYLLEWSPLPAWLTIVILLLTTLYIYLTWPLYFGKQMDIPGPRPQLLFGTMKEDAAKGSLRSDTENQALYGKVFLTWMGRTPVINVSDPEILREIMSTDFYNFVDKPPIVEVEELKKPAISLLGGDHWKYVRSILTPTFSSGKLRQMVPIINCYIERLVTTFGQAEQTGETIDVSKSFSALTMDVILASAFGVQVNSQDNPEDPFVKHAKLVFEGVNQIKVGVAFSVLFPFLLPILRHFKAGVMVFDPNGFFSRSLRTIINQRKEDTGYNRVDLLQLMINARADDIHSQKQEDGPEVDKDFLSNMTKKRQNKGLNDGEIVAQALTFLLAGYETTGTVLTYMSYCLALYPDIQERLAREIDEQLNGEKPTYDNTQKLQYLEMCVNECMRMYTPVVRIIRQTKEERTLKGFTFPKGSSVNLLLYAVHHDPDNWAEPDKFDPERFSPANKPNIRPCTFVPFWGGPRNCIGMRFGMMEAKMALTSLLQKYRLQLAPEMEVPINPKGGIALIGTVPTLLKIRRR